MADNVIQCDLLRDAGNPMIFNCLLRAVNGKDNVGGRPRGAPPNEFCSNNNVRVPGNIFVAVMFFDVFAALLQSKVTARKTNIKSL